MSDEQSLRSQLEEFQILFDSIPIMLWYKDQENRTVRVNRAAASLEGLPASELEGKSSYDLYPKEQADAFYNDDMEVVNSGKAKLDIIEKHTSPSTGELKWMHTGKVPYRTREGEIKGVIAFATDITRQKEAEEALEKKNQQMTRAQVFFRSTREQLTEAIQRNASQDELLSYLNDARIQFERLDT
jgi:PAS domain S-box-containing protein